MKKKTIILLNVLIIVFELIGLYLSVDDFGLKMITYYTEYSNFFALFSSIILIIYLLKDRVPKWVRFFRYITATLLTITFLVVACVLAPLIGEKGYMMFTYDSMLYHHLLCPILFFISFIFFEKGCPITKKDPFYCMIPTVFYGVLMIILNLLGAIVGPYPFFVIGLLPVYINIPILIFVSFIAYLSGLYLFKLSMYRNKKIAN